MALYCIYTLFRFLVHRLTVYNNIVASLRAATMKVDMRILSHPVRAMITCGNGRANTSYRGFSNFSGLGASTAGLQRESNKGKSVIVTGSSRGIGKAIALRLAADGYSVCINDIGANSKGGKEVVKEIESLGQKACFAAADVSKRDEVVAMIQTSVKELGPLNTM